MAVAGSSFQVILPPGTKTWLVPPGWDSSNSLIELIGEGGTGVSGNNDGGGGAGGMYAASANLVFAPGTLVPVQIGTGGTGTDTSFNAGQVLAKAGPNGAGVNGGVAPPVSAGVGQIIFPGGNGGSTVGGNGQGAGGGGAAGPNGAGAPGENGGSGPGGPGLGGAAGNGKGGAGGQSIFTSDGNGGDGAEWGSAGSGGGGSGTDGGAGKQAGKGGLFGGGGGGGGGPFLGNVGGGGGIRITWGIGQPSQTTDFELSNAQILAECFERLQITDPEFVRNNIRSAQISLNLELQRFGSPARGPALWKILYGQTINLVAGQLTYPIDPSILSITEMWLTTVNGNGEGLNSDRIMLPITRTQYAMIPNKAQPGWPTQFWFQRLTSPLLTIWQPAVDGAPSYILTYNALQRIDDAGIATGEVPDVVYRALDALCARLTYRLAQKFLPRAEWQQALPVYKAAADEAWADFATDDQEDGPMIMQPNIAAYGKLR